MTSTNHSSPARIVYLGAPEADAAAFEARARADFPGIALLATNDRAHAMLHLDSAEAVIAHHFQFDDDMLMRAPRLRWIQSLTTGTDAIVKLQALRHEVTLTSTRGMHGPQMSELVFLHMLALLRDFPQIQRNQSAARAFGCACGGAHRAARRLGASEAGRFLPRNLCRS